MAHTQAAQQSLGASSAVVQPSLNDLELPTPSRPRISILPATAADVPVLAAVQRRAYASTLITRLIFSDVSEADDLAGLEAQMSKALQVPSQALYKAVDEEGVPLGMALWELPKPEGYVVEKKERTWAPGTNVELAVQLFCQPPPPSFGRGPRYHLTLLAVDPSAQRRGTGSALLQWGCEKADNEGLVTTLKATDVGVPLYERFGFRAAAEPVRAGANGEMQLLPMARPPSTLHAVHRPETPSRPEI